MLYASNWAGADADL